MKQYVKLILYPSSINLSWIEQQCIPPIWRNNNITRYLVLIEKWGMAESKMFCHTTKTKERCCTHHRQAIFNHAAKKYSHKSNVLARAWLMSRVSPLVYKTIIFVWLELLACHMKWKCEWNADHSTSTQGRLASTHDVTCDLYCSKLILFNSYVHILATYVSN